MVGANVPTEPQNSEKQTQKRKKSWYFRRTHGIPELKTHQKSIKNQLKIRKIRKNEGKIKEK